MVYAATKLPEEPPAFLIGPRQYQILAIFSGVVSTFGQF